MGSDTRTPIFLYHAIDRRRSIISIPSSVFAWQMRWLHEEGFQVIPLRELVQRLRTRDLPPTRAVVITFDDGFSSVYTSAFPVLARYGFPATVFLVPGYCGGRNDWPGQPSTIPRQALLTWAQVAEMDRHGIEFGAHSLSHARLDHLTPEKIEREILDSKTSIEDHLGHAVELFAYPYGRHNDTVKAIVRRAYSGACSAHLGLVGPSSDPFALERVDVHYLAQPWVFRRLSTPLFSLYLGVRRPLRTVASLVLNRPWR